MEAAFTNQTELAIECYTPPDLVNSDRKRYIISQPPGPFPKKQKGRSFSSYHYHFLSANVRIQRQCFAIRRSTKLASDWSIEFFPSYQVVTA